MLTQAPADALFIRTQFRNIGLTDAADVRSALASRIALPGLSLAGAVALAGIRAFVLGVGAVGSRVLTGGVWIRLRERGTGRRIPQHHSAIHPRRCQSRSRMRERHEMDPALMPGHGGDLVAGGDVPEPHDIVERSEERRVGK